ncbi:MAG: CDP-diacylglycerol--serine O-phosphatidyltransferase [Gammaproteobacteria bacterium]|nr:CDP-diacylglycerol--serine O-phosphatidyltransferase [Gammaproteobacteria bacterium]NND38005.1 CDP-diacylglycerol--serine O-phosphatidyltransferase [Pseudomonadales bacterium]NNL10279.1 CDP-diacylglycerol--serine O-phosphatidyltransferase [Pseudomonadales bacterium]NNM12273.1 CDP-diacylglycerol--serine O-phosphatidyltransferase [Pseudomonadales bacterium]
MKKNDNVTSLGNGKSAEQKPATDGDSASQADSGNKRADATAEVFLPIDEHFEEVSVGGKKERRAGIYLLPNLFTSAALFAGFYAIVAGMNGEFGLAGLAIFFGQLLDGVDGRVARLTNTQSQFGQEFDSLSDMVTFGLAPALIMFMWCLSGLGTLGWAVAFVYVASAAVRLARFNAQAETADNRYFTGLASPPAATLIASTVWLGHEYGYTSATLPGWLVITMTVQTAVVGFLMVMNVRYSSFKGIDFGSRVPVVALLFFLLMLVLIAANPPIVLFIIAFTYALSGPVIALYRRIRYSD